MEITEVRIKLMEEPGERLKAFCSITFDNCFVVRDLKIIDGSNGLSGRASVELTIDGARELARTILEAVQQAEQLHAS